MLFIFQRGNVIMQNENNLLSTVHTRYLKGIAILFVLISHIGNYSGKTWFTPLGGIGVSIFLFCSGFGLMSSYQKNGLSYFWIKKIHTIYIPFIIIETIAACFSRSNILDYVLDILLLKTLNPYEWYMQYIVICYLIFFCVCRFCSNKTVRYCIWVGFSVVSFIFCGNLQGEQCLAFLIGIYVAEHINNFKQCNKRKERELGLTLIVVSILLLLLKQTDFLRQQSHYIVTLLNLIMKSNAMLGIVFVTNSFRIANKVFSFFGDISYFLYLIHAHLMEIIAQNLTGKYMMNTLILVILSIGLSWIFVCFMKKIKEKRKNDDTQGISFKQ